MDCLAWYKATCDFVPNCMELITAEMVETAGDRQWAAIPPASPLTQHDGGAVILKRTANR